MMFFQSNSSEHAIVQDRRGFSLVEIIAAMFLLATAMTLTVEIVAWSAKERRSADRRQVAHREAANALERLVIDPSRDIPLSPYAEKVLPGASIEIETTPEPDLPRLARVSVLVRYEDRGQPAAPVRLTTWLVQSSAEPTENGAEP